MSATAMSQSPGSNRFNVKFSAPATDKQKDFIILLGGKVKPDLTNGEASQYINVLKRKATRAHFAEERFKREERQARQRGEEAFA